MEHWKLFCLEKKLLPFHGQRPASRGHGQQSWPFFFPSFAGTQGCVTQKVWVPRITWKGLRQEKIMQLVNETVVKPATRSFLKRETLLPSAGKGKTGRQGSELGMTIPCACQPTTGWFCQGEWRKAKMEQQAWVNVQWCTNKAFQPKTDRRCSQLHVK